MDPPPTCGPGCSGLLLAQLKAFCVGFSEHNLTQKAQHLKEVPVVVPVFMQISSDF